MRLCAIQSVLQMTHSEIWAKDNEMLADIYCNRE